jgi:hypothetical protein
MLAYLVPSITTFLLIDGWSHRIYWLIDFTTLGNMWEQYYLPTRELILLSWHDWDLKREQ